MTGVCFEVLYAMLLLAAGACTVRWRDNLAHGIARRRYAMFHAWPLLRDLSFLYRPAFWAPFVGVVAVMIIFLGGVEAWWAIADVRVVVHLHRIPLALLPQYDPVGDAAMLVLGCSLLALGAYILHNQAYMAEVIRLSWQTDVPITASGVTKTGVSAELPDPHWVAVRDVSRPRSACLAPSCCCTQRACFSRDQDTL